MDDQVSLSLFPDLCGPANHYQLHVNLYLDPGLEFVRERVLPESGSMVMVVRDYAAGHNYRLVYEAVDELARLWRLIAATPWDVGDPAAEFEARAL